MSHIIDFQTSHGLPPTGKIGSMTCRAMMKAWGLTREQFANLMGNLHNETGNFTRDTENLNYSVQGLADTWPSRFAVNPSAGKKTPNDRAKQFAMITTKGQARQMAIANEVYANRMGNGLPSTGDGWKYRGRGPLQGTGKKYYRILEEWLRHHKLWKSGNASLLITPDLVNDVYYWESALFFFTVNKLWTIARTVDDATITKIRRKTNGGTIGLPEVKKLTAYYYNLAA
jgi:putative chitinase